MDETNPPVQNTTPIPETTDTPAVSTARFSKNSIKIVIIIIALLIFATVSAFAYIQITQPENSLFGKLNGIPTPTATPTIAPAATPALTPTPTLAPRPTLAMTFQEIINTYCTKRDYETGGYTYIFDTEYLPITITDPSITPKQNQCELLMTEYGGFIRQSLSNGLTIELIDNETMEPGHGGSSFWGPDGGQIYTNANTELYAFIPLGDVGPGPTLEEVYLNIRGIKYVTLSNGDIITVVITHSPVVPKDNSELVSIMRKYTKEIEYDDGGTIEVIDTSKPDLYYQEIYDTFFKNLDQSDASIQATYNLVLTTLESIEGK